MKRLASVLVVVAALSSCRDRANPGERATPPTPSPGDASILPVDASFAFVPTPLPPDRAPLTGTDFPDGVLALTWDDGPDAHSLELARYLHDQHVPATFFVVGSWVEGVSEEPGVGANKLKTGYEHIPVAELGKLGHRIAAHTRHHRLLAKVTLPTAKEELGDAPFAAEQVRMFRAPGGAWTDESKSVFRDPAFADLVGPIHWDIDAKDWECSLYCRSDAKASECEPGPIQGEPRVRAEVIAARYLAQIESAKHGIVLLHDRVGDVGSTYALTIAKHLVPELVKRHYVFAPPVLRFGPLVHRANAPSSAQHRADLNGDGTLDECAATPAGVYCALSDGTELKAPSLWSKESLDAFTLADLNGDGRADLCSGDRCALAP